MDFKYIAIIIELLNKSGLLKGGGPVKYFINTYQKMSCESFKKVSRDVFINNINSLPLCSRMSEASDELKEIFEALKK